MGGGPKKNENEFLTAIEAYGIYGPDEDVEYKEL